MYDPLLDAALPAAGFSGRSMDLGLTDKVAIVTGSSRGLGLASARALASEGCRVVMCARGADRLDAAAAEVRAIGGADRVLAVRADVSSESGAASVVEGAVARFGGLDILVNNVGFTVPGFLRELGDKDWHHVLDACLSSTFYGIRAALGPMRNQKSGSIINIGSAAGVGGAPGLGVYGAAKAGVISLTQTAALENFKAGVRVNCVLPNAATKPLLEWFDTTPGGRRTRAAIEAYSRCGSPDEIASAVLFLAGADSSYVNGAILPVDGGLSARQACVDAEIE